MKTQKSFKKRALLSSIAMLLVATVAVGSATFAWFSSNNTATASGINVKTAKQSNLLIKNSVDPWRTLVNYDQSNKILLPASSVLVNENGRAPWFTAEAPDYDKSGVKSITQIDDNIANTYYYHDELNIKNDGAVDVEDVKVELTWGTGSSKEYIRVALVPMNADGTSVDTTKSPIIFSDTASESYSALIGKTIDKNVAKDVASVTTHNSQTLTIGVMKPEAELYYDLYVWFEGQDPECVDSKAGQEIKDITFTVTGNPVKATEPTTAP